MCTFCTRAVTDLSKPTFGENFPIAISKNKLVTKTLQVNVWTIDLSSKEECLGSAQVSMADFKTSTTSVKWYNVLSFHFMQAEPVKKPASASRHSRSSSLSRLPTLPKLTSPRIVETEIWKKEIYKKVKIFSIPPKILDENIYNFCCCCR